MIANILVALSVIVFGLTLAEILLIKNKRSNCSNGLSSAGVAWTT